MTCPICAERLARLVWRTRTLSDLVADWGEDEELPGAVEALGRFLGVLADEIERSCHLADE